MFWPQQVNSIVLEDHGIYIFLVYYLSLSLCACIRLNWSFPMREESHAPRAYEGTAARSSQKPARLPVVTCFKWFSSLSFQPWFDGSTFAFRPAALIGRTAAESRSPRGLCVGRFLVTFCHSESETLRQNSFFTVALWFLIWLEPYGNMFSIFQGEVGSIYWLFCQFSLVSVTSTMFGIMLSGLHNWHNARKDPSDKTTGNKNSKNEKLKRKNWGQPQ